MRSGQPGRACTAARLARTAQSGEGPAGGRRATVGPRKPNSGLVAKETSSPGRLGRASAAGRDIHSRVTRTGRTGQYRLGWQLASGGDECSRRGPSRASRVGPERQQASLGRLSRVRGRPGDVGPRSGHASRTQAWRRGRDRADIYNLTYARRSRRAGRLFTGSIGPGGSFCHGNANRREVTPR